MKDLTHICELNLLQENQDSLTVDLVHQDPKGCQERMDTAVSKDNAVLNRRPLSKKIKVNKTAGFIGFDRDVPAFRLCFS